jgi:hypothetical protein
VGACGIVEVYAGRKRGEKICPEDEQRHGRGIIVVQIIVIWREAVIGLRPQIGHENQRTVPCAAEDEGSPRPKGHEG